VNRSLARVDELSDQIAKKVEIGDPTGFINGWDDLARCGRPQLSASLLAALRTDPPMPPTRSGKATRKRSAASPARYCPLGGGEIELRG